MIDMREPVSVGEVILRHVEVVTSGTLIKPVHDFKVSDEPFRVNDKGSLCFRAQRLSSVGGRMVAFPGSDKGLVCFCPQVEEYEANPKMLTHFTVNALLAGGSCVTVKAHFGSLDELITVYREPVAKWARLILAEADLPPEALFDQLIAAVDPSLADRLRAAWRGKEEITLPSNSGGSEG